MQNPLLSSKPAKLAPDLVIVNATIRTMDGKNPHAGALAILGNRIVAVGQTEAVRSLAGGKTRIINAGKKLVLPGLNDAHVHFLSGGFSRAQVDLRDAKSPGELAQRLLDYARKTPRDRWILGGEWDHEQWPNAPLPTKELIDAATSGHPVAVNRLDGHMLLANSLALKFSGVTRKTPAPPGGEIVRDNHGQPTGIFKDTAQDLIKVPTPSWDEKLAAARAATDHAARLGVTSVTDMSADGDVGLYQFMARSGELKTRIYALRSIVSWEVLRQVGVRAAFGDDLVRLGGLKGFSDGSLGSTTARFFEPYADAPDTRGLWCDQMLPPGTMEKRVLEADQAGLQVIIHAIGDEANAKILDLCRNVAKRNGARDRRFRIEHAQHLRPRDIARFGRQKVIASVQPYHAADDGRWCDRRLGPKRLRGTYAFRSLLDSGAVLALGTDWTVAPLEPMLTIQAAVTRQTLDGKHPGGWNPGEKISVSEAVHAYTVGSAYAEFTEDKKGMLAPGKLADIVMLDRDIFSIDPGEIDKTRAVLTVMDGQVVYEAK
jgi:predicted amidohydrolase YtcJ